MNSPSCLSPVLAYPVLSLPNVRFGSQAVATIFARWIFPDVYRQQDYSVSKAKKAISDYRKAVDRLEGMAELTVFYCEEAFNLFDVYAVEDEGYYTALVRMFEQAMKRVIALPEHERGSAERSAQGSMDQPLDDPESG